MSFQKVAAGITTLLVTGSAGGATIYTQLPEQVQVGEKKENTVKAQTPEEHTYTFDFRGQKSQLVCREGYLPHADANYVNNKITVSIVCSRANGAYGHDIGKTLQWTSFGENWVKCQASHRGDLNYQCSSNRGNQPNVRLHEARYRPTDSYTNKFLIIT
ncbi:hypothetical protein MHLP_01200 [Candidatus Mycoplasma haematolamae str. Purdue]|uniref:Uncharacterized protein n=1 Tax=Mycoplasma haematolamae (strain Purdue) TaxID=1212765 RepID=I7B969_MYCHA|nr:hypothetical protein [Candidatus Mycoplasma haematolamae]AFO51820.1 hypothetical protein MHLP_01200 [Candidatus Mycoplasma haematolamae str. Purdue]